MLLRARFTSAHQKFAVTAFGWDLAASEEPSSTSQSHSFRPGHLAVCWLQFDAVPMILLPVPCIPPAPARVTISRVIQPDGLIHGDCPQRHCVVPVLESLCSMNPPQLQTPAFGNPPAPALGHKKLPKLTAAPFSCKIWETPGQSNANNNVGKHRAKATLIFTQENQHAVVKRYGNTTEAISY
ncbi:hypothetical protein Anapl_12383 [Anas platyrhynchos]|uniref:Uncharacterized protein n=1 Tax=Anas platyrhynchos TaxID=8839 RepID=R0L0M2_ANAPL|nr:hypothetical protein Anapl_12383 [Anas platyrhynchos]